MSGMEYEREKAQPKREQKEQKSPFRIDIGGEQTVTVRPVFPPSGGESGMKLKITLPAAPTLDRPEGAVLPNLPTGTPVTVMIQTQSLASSSTRFNFANFEAGNSMTAAYEGTVNVGANEVEVNANDSGTNYDSSKPVFAVCATVFTQGNATGSLAGGDAQNYDRASAQPNGAPDSIGINLVGYAPTSQVDFIVSASDASAGRVLSASVWVVGLQNSTDPVPMTGTPAATVAAAVTPWFQEIETSYPSADPYVGIGVKTFDQRGNEVGSFTTVFPD